MTTLLMKIPDWVFKTIGIVGLIIFGLGAISAFGDIIANFGSGGGCASYDIYGCGSEY